MWVRFPPRSPMTCSLLQNLARWLGNSMISLVCPGGQSPCVVAGRWFDSKHRWCWILPSYFQDIWFIFQIWWFESIHCSQWWLRGWQGSVLNKINCHVAVIATSNKEWCRLTGFHNGSVDKLDIVTCLSRRNFWVQVPAELNFQWPYRLKVRSRPFQGWDLGALPNRAAI